VVKKKRRKPAVQGNTPQERPSHRESNCTARRMQRETHHDPPWPEALAPNPPRRMPAYLPLENSDRGHSDVLLNDGTAIPPSSPSFFYDIAAGTIEVTQSAKFQCVITDVEGSLQAASQWRLVNISLTVQATYAPFCRSEAMGDHLDESR
jgi:hypothetical protein